VLAALLLTIAWKRKSGTLTAGYSNVAIPALSIRLPLPTGTGRVAAIDVAPARGALPLKVPHAILPADACFSQNAATSFAPTA
jgi:hypothetical protein